MSVDLCDNCPVLLAAAEEERLLGAGMERNDWGVAEPLIVGRLRREHGCRGPVETYGGFACRWEPRRRSNLQPLHNVPLLTDRASKENTGQYL